MEEQKAFRLPIVVKTMKDGKPVRVSMPSGAAQADQGSDMIIVTVGFLKKLGLPVRILAESGLNGLTMNVADGSSARLTHYAELKIGVHGIWRRVEAFVRLFSEDNKEDIHLLLGLPWLFTVDAKIKIKDSLIEIGDVERGEEIKEIKGPKFVGSEGHKLILCQVARLETKEVEDTESSGDESEDQDSEDDDDIESSDEEECHINAPRIGRNKLSSKVESLWSDTSPSHCLPGSNVENLHESKIPCYPEVRRSVVRELSEASQEVIDEWIKNTGVKIGILMKDQRDKLARLLYPYKDLNSTGVEDLPFTDLYVHRVRLKEGTKPFSRIKQRRWPPGKEFWMRRIISDGLKFGLYESTIRANGKLSDWNAMAQLVDKSDNPDEWDEPRLTFDYQNVKEDKLGCFVELLSRCHDYLGDPSHEMFFKLDLKNGYWAIMVHPDDRHLFAFSMPGMGQLQPTRIPQGSKGLRYMCKYIYRRIQNE
ncbi:hypothetical protein EPUL_004983, partial [Erysiphe pulchra]